MPVASAFTQFFAYVVARIVRRPQKRSYPANPGSLRRASLRVKIAPNNRESGECPITCAQMAQEHGRTHMFREITTLLTAISTIYTFVTPPNVKAASFSETAEEITVGSNCSVSSQEILLPRPNIVSPPFQKLDDLAVRLQIPDETAAAECVVVLSMELGQNTPSSIEPIDIGYEIVFGNGERIQECSINSLSIDHVGASGPSTIQVLRTAPQQGTNTYTISNLITLGFGASESVTITPCARASNKLLARRNFVLRAVGLERQAACLNVQCPLLPRPSPPPPPPPPVPLER
jgi:hypothetical protein